VHSPDVAIGLRMLRLASLDDRALGMQLIRMEVETGEADVMVEASFGGLAFGLVTEKLDQDLGVWHTNVTGKRLAIAAAASLDIDGEKLAAHALGPFKQAWTWRARPGKVAYFNRSIAVIRRDTRDGDPVHHVREKLGISRAMGWHGTLARHEAAWVDRWDRSDVKVDGDAGAQQALRFAAYHLNSAANPHDERVSIGARALTGADYHGHVFWDTEIFLLPFYTLTWPEAARTLLMYRFHTLEGARAKAACMGWRGAMYAWESANSGAEMTPQHATGPDRKVVDIRCGTQEQHIGADIAYAVWQYWSATGDTSFLLEAGAEILLETGRFWASRAVLEADGLHHIRGVIGPDEYHETIDDNAFTNVMARWNIRRAIEVAALMRARWPERWADLSCLIGLNDTELQDWSGVADKMATGLHPRTELFEQFEGYFALEEIDLTRCEDRSVPMDVVLGPKRTAASQVAKQADVIALLGLLPEEFPGKSGAANFVYYEPRCSHGSSLSRAMHGLVAARLGRTEMALDFFRQTSAINLADTPAAIDGGVHIAALGGIWMTAVLGFAGLSLREDGLALNPQLPKDWAALSFGMQWRGRALKITVRQADPIVEATLQSGEYMTLVFGGTPHELRQGTPLLIERMQSGGVHYADNATAASSFAGRKPG
jgi:trehalose/maltose hydrolase-like predicted phosphorylase